MTGRNVSRVPWWRRDWERGKERESLPWECQKNLFEFICIVDSNVQTLLQTMQEVNKRINAPATHQLTT